jgi:glycosyltransferase involved in cell wall biosynthesis
MDSTQDLKRPLVSVILIVRNGGDYLSPQIDSILAQTYSNLELLVCDDCSTDGTPGLVQDYMRRDSRVRYVRNEVNLRVSLTFERQCHLCRGEFIAPSDADDFWLPEKIEKQAAYLIAHPNTQLVFTDDMIVNQDLSVKMGSFQKTMGNYSPGGDISIGALLERNVLAFHVSCFRRTMIPKLLPMPEQSILMYDAWAALVCSLTGPIGYINECLVLYRQHQSNMVGAGVRNTAFYFRRVNDSSFLGDYIRDKSGQMAIHKRLLAMEPGSEARKALTEKIDNQTSLLAIAQAATFGQFVSRLAGAAFTILKTSQSYHFKQWFFLALSWGGIKKLKLEGREK